MSALSGTFAGTVTSQATLGIEDEQNHELSLAQVRGPQTSPDPRWDGAVITYSAHIELIGPHGTQRGYFVNSHKDGDTDFGSFEGEIAPEGDGVGCQGTWKFTGGTGRYQGITGNGSFRMRLSGKSVQTTWDGSYELASKAAGANQGD